MYVLTTRLLSHTIKKNATIDPNNKLGTKIKTGAFRFSQKD